MTRQTFIPTLRSQLSHELLTPLSGMLQLLFFLSETPMSSEQAEYVHDIQEAAESLLGAQQKMDAMVAQCHPRGSKTSSDMTGNG